MPTNWADTRAAATLWLTTLCVQDRKSTRLNSSHVAISYAVFCLKTKKREPLPPAPLSKAQEIHHTEGSHHVGNAVVTTARRRVEAVVGEDPVNVHFFFFNDTATTEIYTLSLHDALPICLDNRCQNCGADTQRACPGNVCT